MDAWLVQLERDIREGRIVNCLPGLVATVASLCPTGTYWYTPARTYVAAPTAIMTRQCDCTNPAFPICTVSFPDACMGDVATLPATAEHHCIGVPRRCQGMCGSIAGIQQNVVSYLLGCPSPSP